MFNFKIWLWNEAQIFKEDYYTFIEFKFFIAFGLYLITSFDYTNVLHFIIHKIFFLNI